MPGKIPQAAARIAPDGQKRTVKVEAGYREWMQTSKNVVDRDANPEQEAPKEVKDSSGEDATGGSDEALMTQLLAARPQRPAVTYSTAVVVVSLLIVGALFIAAGLQQKWHDRELAVIKRSSLVTSLPTTTPEERSPPGRFLGATGTGNGDGADAHFETQDRGSETLEPTVITSEEQDGSGAST
ncbi:uncharacterized protein LOC144163911 [Haemaphysalis longicornis]